LPAAVPPSTADTAPVVSCASGQARAIRVFATATAGKPAMIFVATARIQPML
jgi:hypothetical protein